MIEIKVVNDFEDCDEDWKEYDEQKKSDGQILMNREPSIPRSTLSGKTALRVVAQGNTVCVNLDSGDHNQTIAYLKAMAEEYNLVYVHKEGYIHLGPEPELFVDAIPYDEEG